jgi:hypothetical protein
VSIRTLLELNRVATKATTTTMATTTILRVEDKTIIMLFSAVQKCLDMGANSMLYDEDCWLFFDL